MLLSLRKNGLTSLFKEVRVFKVEITAIGITAIPVAMSTLSSTDLEVILVAISLALCALESLRF